jgi:7-cyano-7-deazaguanine reductase
MPETQVAMLTVPVAAAAIVESKSLKLYLGSLNFEVFASASEVIQRVSSDLAAIVGSALWVTLLPLPIALPNNPSRTEIWIDATAPDCRIYQPDATLLQRQETWIEETLLSYVLRTCCPVTGQPDWATTRIRYQGRAFSHAGLVRYLVSFRQHQGFHEECVEQIWTDLLMCGDLTELEVMCQFTRRGGVDISPHRWLRGTSPQLLWLRDSRQ